MKIANDIVADWTIRVDAWFKKEWPQLSRQHVTFGRDCWAVAHATGILKEAYRMDRSIVDAHIQTALEKIFPNAVFAGKKRY